MKDRWSKDGPIGIELAEIQRAVSQTMRGAIQDAYHGISQSASMLPPRQREEPPRPPSSGVTDLKVPGVNHVDAIAQSFEQRERLEVLTKQLALVRELTGNQATLQKPENVSTVEETDPEAPTPKAEYHG